MNFFHFCISSMHLWSAAGALHMVQYYGVRVDSSKIVLNEDYPEDDPFFLRSLHMRQIVCDRIIRAKQYVVISYTKYKTTASNRPNAVEVVLVPQSTNFQRAASTPRYPDPPYLHYQSRKKIRVEGRTIFSYKKTLECVRMRERNWFIFFTAEEDRYLLCEPYENYSELIATAMFEPQAEYNMNFPGLEGYDRLHQYFYDEIKSGTKEGRAFMGYVPIEMALCDLTLGEYGRLCSTAFDTLSHRDIGYFQEDVRYVNYNYLNQRYCLPKTIELISGERAHAQVVPCAINRVYWIPQFYILADSKVRGAVFILVDKTDGKVKLKTIELLARLGKIRVLLDRATRTPIPNPDMHS